MRNLLYAIIGLLVSVMFIVNLLTGIPNDLSKNVIVTAPKVEDTTTEYITVENFYKASSYSINEGKKRTLINAGIADYGRIDPMNFYTKPAPIIPEPTELTPEPQTEPTTGMVIDEDGNVIIVKNPPSNEGSDPNPSQYIMEFNWETFENSYVLPRGYLFAYDKTSKKIRTTDVSALEGDIMQNGYFPVDKDLYEVSSNYGIRKNPFDLTTDEFHKGLDIASTNIENSNVYSILSGKVTFYDDGDEGYGKYAKVDHGEYYTIYAHLAAFNKEIEDGQTVSGGDILGYVGNTGKSTGPHLHLEIEVDGTKVNPRHFLNLLMAYRN